MQQQGEYTINGSVDSVWQALNNADALKASIPGCQSIEQVDAENLNATVRAKVGPLNAAFRVTLELTDVKAPYSYTLNGQVKGGAGIAKGSAHVQLEALPDDPTETYSGPRTRLSYQVQATVGGKLAQVGSRLIDGAATKMADDFFAAFSEAFMQDDSEQSARDTQADATQTQSDVETPVERAKDGTGFIWITAFVVLITAMVLAL